MFCYALKSARFTYIGKTCDLKRRLRQHTGGAKYTCRDRPWNFYLYVSGFETASHALCFEWSWKRHRSPGIRGVLRGLNNVINKERWTRKCPLASTIPLKIHATDMAAVQKLKLPTPCLQQKRQMGS